ncbi:MAG TPA: hypothetical protein VMR65_12570 [Candidatus Sulfotelmatobacter sp.]|jgi:hypothetical protein|nr:hypothetical protein [Candidatus Sulfotelmatobacter sp.]
MNTKTPIAKPQETERAIPDDLRTAYQIHTLAQILLAKLASPMPWGPVMPPAYPPIVH